MQQVESGVCRRHASVVDLVVLGGVGGEEVVIVVEVVEVVVSEEVGVREEVVVREVGEEVAVGEVVGRSRGSSSSGSR